MATTASNPRRRNVDEPTGGDIMIVLVSIREMNVERPTRGPFRVRSLLSNASRPAAAESVGSER